ncbi:MAG: RnfABCDGE type electron transport complex subunit D [Deltaproteobacteria bacterium]|nr:RnfABCDGE type electron transport complex subunit D [Deltaproteobacteria bacterium]
MLSQKLLVGSHAPYWHSGISIREKSTHTLLAALPAVLMGIYQFGVPALRVMALSISCAILWEFILNRVMKRPLTVGDGDAAVIGLLFGMLLPATAPWWVVVLGTAVAVTVGKWIYGGLGGNPLNPALVAIATLIISYKGIMDLDQAYLNFDFGFPAADPLKAVKALGTAAVARYSLTGLLMGQQVGGIGTIFALGLMIGGLYLILRGFIRWEISLSYIAGILVTAYVFNLSNPEKYAGPWFHLLAGYTLLGAFFLITEYSSSPVNLIPMLVYGAGAGVMTILIRNVGGFTDGVVFAILLFNITNPLLDKIRPRALGRSN